MPLGLPRATDGEKDAYNCPLFVERALLFFVECLFPESYEFITGEGTHAKKIFICSFQSSFGYFE